MGDIDLSRLDWLNPPVGEQADGAGLRLLTRPRTDFWQRTHYGFRHDDGHFLFRPTDGDFVAELTVEIEPNAQFDQAGLMVRFSPSCWLKTSCEYQPAQPAQFGAVVTNAGFSDWSYRPVAPFPKRTRFRIERLRGDYVVSTCVAGEPFDVVRIARLLEDDGNGPALVGPYACSPKGDGCPVQFTEFTLGPA